MVIASRMRSIENFAGIMNFLMFPMFFLSSALYPAATLPGFLQPLVRANPLTYGGRPDAPPAPARALPREPRRPTTPSSFDVLGAARSSAVILLLLACLLFGEEDHLGRILLTEPGRKRAGRGRAPEPSRSTAPLA